MCEASDEYSMVKLAIVGAGGVGKSAITVQFLQGKFLTEYDPTIEDSYRKQMDIEGQTTILDILDTAGQEEFSAMRDQYMSSGEGFMVVYSVIARPTFNEIITFRQNIWRIKNGVYPPMVIVGNKCDLEDQRQVTPTEGNDLATNFGVPFFETSALTRVNVEEAFFSLVRAVWDFREKAKSDPAKLKSPGTGRKRRVCTLF